MDTIARGAFGMPRPQGWTIERIVYLLAGAVVFATQLLGRQRWTPRRILAGWAGANLLLDAAVGWCPMSVFLHRAGVPSVAERARSTDPRIPMTRTR